MISWCLLCLSHHSAVHQSCLAVTALDLQDLIEERVSAFYWLIDVFGFFYKFFLSIFVPVHNIKMIHSEQILRYWDWKELHLLF